MLRKIVKNKIMSLYSFRIIKLAWIAGFKPEPNIKCLLYNNMLSLKLFYGSIMTMYNMYRIDFG